MTTKPYGSTESVYYFPIFQLNVTPHNITNMKKKILLILYRVEGYVQTMILKLITYFQHLLRHEMPYVVRYMSTHYFNLNNG